MELPKFNVTEEKVNLIFKSYLHFIKRLSLHCFHNFYREDFLLNLVYSFYIQVKNLAVLSRRAGKLCCSVGGGAIYSTCNSDCR